MLYGALQIQRTQIYLQFINITHILVETRKIRNCFRNQILVNQGPISRFVDETNFESLHPMLNMKQSFNGDMILMYLTLNLESWDEFRIFNNLGQKRQI